MYDKDKRVSRETKAGFMLLLQKHRSLDKTVSSLRAGMVPVHHTIPSTVERDKI